MPVVKCKKCGMNYNGSDVDIAGHVANCKGPRELPPFVAQVAPPVPVTREAVLDALLRRIVSANEAGSSGALQAAFDDARIFIGGNDAARHTEQKEEDKTGYGIKCSHGFVTTDGSCMHLP